MSASSASTWGWTRKVFSCFARRAHRQPKLIVATEDAADQEVLQVDISLEVADVDAVHAEAQRLGLQIVYPLTDEPWGIRRFFLRDPDGLVLNVSSHVPV